MLWSEWRRIRAKNRGLVNWLLMFNDLWTMMCLSLSGIKYGLHHETFQISQLETNLTTHSVSFSPVCQ